MSIFWTRQAVADVESIREYIAQDSRTYAVLVAERIVASVERLAAFPQSGRIVPEVGDPSLREVIHGTYRIVYRNVEADIHVITVHHSSRLFKL